MESFSIVKRGYNPQEVDEYIETLENVIKSYKDKDNAIKNAIISAQVAADNIIKNTHLEAAEYKKKTFENLRLIYESIETQRRRIQEFHDDYREMLQKYLQNISVSESERIYMHIDELEKYLRELSESIDDDASEDSD